MSRGQDKLDRIINGKALGHEKQKAQAAIIEACEYTLEVVTVAVALIDPTWSLGKAVKESRWWTE